MKKYIVQSGKQFNFNFHNAQTIVSKTAVEGDVVECERNQVYVTIDDTRIHTTNYAWVVSKAVTDGILVEV
jgi:hypothetical protein